MPPRRRRPRGHVEELPSSSFRAIVYAGVDPLTGKKRYLKETTKTFGAAEVALTKLQRQVDEEAHPKTSITVGQAIAQWLDVAKLEDTTRERYEDLVRIYIRPTFGNLAAAKLDTELLEKFYARLQRCRLLCAEERNSTHKCRPLSSSTVRKIHFIISAALERAVRWRHLSINKAAFAAAPSPVQTEPDPPTPEEAATVLSEAWAIDPDWGLMLWLTMVTGGRRGEMSALRWKHVDFGRGVLTHWACTRSRFGRQVRAYRFRTGQMVARPTHACLRDLQRHIPHRDKVLKHRSNSVSANSRRVAQRASR